ncbi:MAG: hypothetical protein ACREIV_01095 [Planctomycetaceae bacterium]
MIKTGLPFELGETLQGTDDDANLINDSWLGQVFEVPASRLGNTTIRGSKARRTGKPLQVIALRNESGQTLFGKRLARLTRTAGYSLVESVDGYAATLAEKHVIIIDEFLSTDGVADNDIFWGLFSGTVTGLTPESGASFNGDIVVGGQLVAATAATTGTSVAGRFSNVTFTAATAGNTSNGFDGFRMAANMVGVALSARTTGETNSDLLIHAVIKL